MNKNNKTASIYCRVSSKRQANCPSLRVQLDICKSYCKNNEIHVINVVEEISSARNVKNLYYLRKLINNIDTTYLLVSDFSRFGRDLSGCLELLRKLKEKNVIVFSVTNNIGYTDFYLDKYRVHDLLNQAQQESDKLSFKIRKSLEWKKKNNIFTGRNPPYGYSIYFVNGMKKLRPNREEERTLSYIMDLYQTKTPGEIVKILNDGRYEYRNDIPFDYVIINKIINYQKKKNKNDMEDILDNLININFE